MVTAYVRTRTTEEVLDMVKMGLKSRQSKAKTEQFSIAKKRQANTNIKSDPTGRMESFSDVDVNISGVLSLLLNAMSLSETFSRPLFACEYAGKHFVLPSWLWGTCQLCLPLLIGTCIVQFGFVLNADTISLCVLSCCECVSLFEPLTALVSL